MRRMMAEILSFEVDGGSRERRGGYGVMSFDDV